MRKSLLFLLPVAAASSPVYADVTLPPLISDNMLLQSPVAAVWGKADPGEQVTVKLGATTSKAVAGKDGKWRVKLEGLKPGSAGVMTVAGKNTLSIQNVAVGDVWICSGQSNMDMTVVKGPWCGHGGVADAEKESAEANYPSIRMFTVPKKGSATPLEDVDGKWEVCQPDTVPHWSAVGYFFARQLHKDLSTPIGMIHTAWSATPAQSWTPTEVLKGDPDFKVTYVDKAEAKFAKLPELQEKYDQELSAWKKAADEAQAAGKPAPKRPTEPLTPANRFAPSALYNGMIFGATQYPIKGAIWYQGESNAAEAERYHRLLPAMITSWRKAWNQPDFPFYIVQLANYMAKKPEPSDSNWANLRDAQRLIATELPNTGMAVTIDIGDEKNIHPLNKQEVGRRLALAAEAKTYGRQVVSTGPLFVKAEFTGPSVRAIFDRSTSINLTTQDKGPIKGFAIAGEDRKFVWAEATKTRADKGHQSSYDLILTAPGVSKPVAVRYAWANNPEVNLVNEAGLPAIPFRTDDWPQVESTPLPVVPSAPVATPAPK